MPNPFDHQSRTWDDHPNRLRLAADLGRALLRRVPVQPDWEVLDYGCGTGSLTLALAPRVRRVVAIDSSRGMLEVLAAKAAAANLHNIECRHADFETDSPPPGPFHLITCAMTLHHVARVADLLGTFFQLLGQGGCLALADLDAEDGSFHADAGSVHHQGFHRESLARALAAAGFDSIQFETAAHSEKHGRTYPVFLALARRP